ncbi:antibiotic biosynthesis monooxygenase family protein [Clostridium intestinale]|uniref:antibiotic biosynthesis monooxygenase family protein n=1 Tax=Clostridium intestinale TaxID=36845 RepID=UPI0028E63DB8|nr:antibiotic biosynthesis monooxygenase family protein [Clostridium intestinale]
MFVVIVKNKVKVEGKEEYIDVSRKFASDMTKVDGCIDAKVLVSNQEEDVVLNYELWESEEVFKKYDGSVFLKYKPELREYFIGNITETFEV